MAKANELKDKKHPNDQKIERSNKASLEASLEAARTVADLKPILWEMLKRV